MPFGKYKGWKLWNLPDSYLEWLIDEDIAKYEPLRSNVRKEWDSRQAGKRRDFHGEQNASRQSRGAMSPKEREMVIAVIDSGYRAISKKVHPDVGGTHEDMVALNSAVQRIRLLLG